MSPKISASSFFSLKTLGKHPLWFRSNDHDDSGSEVSHTIHSTSDQFDLVFVYLSAWKQKSDWPRKGNILRWIWWENIMDNINPIQQRQRGKVLLCSWLWKGCVYRHITCTRETLSGVSERGIRREVDKAATPFPFWLLPRGKCINQKKST